MSKMSKEVANLLHEIVVENLAKESEGLNWWYYITETYLRYSIDNPVTYEIEILDNLDFSVVIKIDDLELFVGDLHDTETQSAIDGAFSMHSYMHRTQWNAYPEIVIYAYDEDNEKDNEILIVVEL
jgi:hypothetical protein